MWTSAHRRRSGALALVIVLVGGVVAVPGVSALAPPGPSASMPAHGMPGAGRAGPLHPPATPIVSAAATRSAGSVWYTQEGSTLSLLNGSIATSSVASLSLRIPLVKSPYPIGYELNGLSDVGDWYQIVIGDNWPGCSSGFAELTETWASSGSGNPPVCDTNVSMSSGDVVQLGINYTSSHHVCFDLTDVTHSVTHYVCVTPPDSGGRSFVTLSSAANGNGYFTGPMTEIANLSASSCPDYTHMPLVNYEWPSGLWVTGYIAWSDDFELGGSYTTCYSGGGGTTLLSGTDPATYYQDTASGTSYGPHWAAGQNFSRVNPSFGWRFQTDPVPVQAPTIAPASTTVGVGANVSLTAAVQGGRSPYTFLWYLDGNLQNATASVFGWTAQGVGAHHVSAYGVDSLLDVGGPSSPVTVTVAGPLGVGAVRVGTVSGGADVGQSFFLQASTTGGIPPFRFVWSGLPTGCASANLSLLPCTPSAAATFSTVVTVSDANGSTVASPPLTWVVAPALTGSLAASATAIDTGRSVNFSVAAAGGRAPYAYAWTGLPAACLPATGSVAPCAPTAPGNFAVGVNVTDANGGTIALAAPLLTVFLAPEAVVLANRTAIDTAMSVLLTAQVSLGAGGYGLSWSGLPTGCPAGNRSLVDCAFGSPGNYSVSVLAVDAVGGQAVSPPIVVHVVAGPSLAFVTPTVQGGPGGTVYLNATLTGGTPGAHYAWLGLPPGCGAPAGPRLLCVPADTGVYNVTLTVTDGAGGTAVAHATITVSAPVAPPSSSSARAGPLLILAVIALAAVGSALVVVVLRRRRPPA